MATISPQLEHAVLDTNTISHCVEALCENGCRSVNDYIARLEAGETLPQTTRLNTEERQQVLNELKAIMAVYDAKK